MRSRRMVGGRKGRRRAMAREGGGPADEELADQGRGLKKVRPIHTVLLTACASLYYSWPNLDNAGQMKIHVLGAGGGDRAGHRLPAFLVDDHLLVDTGGAAGGRVAAP